MKNSKLSLEDRTATNRTVVPQAVTLKQLRIRTIDIQIIGTTPLIMLQFSEKAKNMMLAKQMGEASAGKLPKNPLALFREAAYRDEGGFLIKAIWFKAAAVACANDVESKQTEMRRAFHVAGPIAGEFCRLKAPRLAKPLTEWDEKFKKELVWEHEHGCSMRCDPVRNASGVADLRFRAWFPEWSCDLRIEFNEAILSADQLCQLLLAAGFGNGVGEWRPASKQSKTGTFGRFTLK